MSHDQYIECDHAFCYVGTHTSVYGNSVDHTEYYWCANCGALKKKHVPRNDFEYDKPVEIELPRITKDQLNADQEHREYIDEWENAKGSAKRFRCCSQVGKLRYSRSLVLDYGSKAEVFVFSCPVCEKEVKFIPGGTSREEAEENGVFVDDWGN